MKVLYSIVGISKQAFHQNNSRQFILNAEQQSLVEQVNAIRKRHPRMGCRTVYDLVDVGLGRDKVEAFLLANGFRVKRKVNFLKTTIRQNLYDFPNLIAGLEIRSINYVWQTDITYFILSDHTVYFMVFIIDVYSRRIIGHTAHKHMRAEANLECLRKAFQIRKGESLAKLIHHSDHGGQYIDKGYLAMLKSAHIKISMGDQAWQNAYSERINGTIKNDYLSTRNIKCLVTLRRALDKDVHAYNTEKPHKNLPNRMSPIAFEEYLKNTEKRNHPRLKIYNHEQH